MNFIRLAGLGLMVGIISASTACSSGDAGTKDDVVSNEASAYSFATHWEISGSLTYGETSAPIAYQNPARFRAVKFAGNEGDEVDVYVRSKTGDAVTWLLDDSMKVVGSNDDAGAGTFDSHVHVTLPKLPKSGSATHYVVFREYDLAPATFTVELQGKPAANVWESCNTDADCVAVPRVGCCHNGYNEAVNTGHVADYEASFTCPIKPGICPLFFVDDTRQAECNNGTKKCEMVAIDKIACGGFTRTPHSCPAGYDCKLRPNIADAPGSCVQRVCVQNQACVRNTHWDTTSCSCVPDQCLQLALCVRTSHWDPTACACVPN